MSTTFKIHTLGCKVNQYDSLNLKSHLLHKGLETTTNSADLVVVNTCAVTKTAISKDKRTLNKIQKENPTAKIVLMGCWPQAYDLMDSVKERVDLVWGVGRLEELTQSIFKLLNIDPEVNNEKTDLVETDKSRYFLKVGDGCNQFCSYCIIPYTRGRLKSREEEELIKETKQALAHGYKEIVLTGIHLGLYGQDGDKTNLYQLLQRLINIEGLGRIRLSSIEINEITEEILDLIKTSDQICPHFHISLQSGSDKILKLMNRPYTTQYFKDKINQLKNIDKNISITTDVMVGFPGETEEDFQVTYNFCKEIGFSKIHVFPFSLHERTAASKLNNKLDHDTIKDRAKRLRQLSENLETDFKHRVSGSTLDLVVERKFLDSLIGKSQYHFSTKIFSKNCKDDIKSVNIGDIIQVDY